MNLDGPVCHAVGVSGAAHLQLTSDGLPGLGLELHGEIVARTSLGAMDGAFIDNRRGDGLAFRLQSPALAILADAVEQKNAAKQDGGKPEQDCFCGAHFFCTVSALIYSTLSQSCPPPKELGVDGLALVRSLTEHWSGASLF